MPEESDNELMLSVKRGELEKMALLFERHHCALYRFLFHMTHHRELSEDMVQNTFYRMLKYRNTFTGNGEFKTWMYHLARNVLKDDWKKSKANRREYDLTEFAEKMEGGFLADEALQKSQDLNLLMKAIKKLNAVDREILVLSRFQQLKYHEIALVVNLSEGAVKTRVHRAINELRNIYLKNGSYEL